MYALDLLVMIADMAGIFIAACWAKREVAWPQGFLMAGLYAGTLAAIVLGGASTIGGVKLGDMYGISGLWFVVMFGLGVLVLSLFPAPRFSIWSVLA